MVDAFTEFFDECPPTHINGSKQIDLISVSQRLAPYINRAFILSDKICMMTTRLACNQAIESSYWRMDNNSDVGLLTGYVLYRLPIELESVDLDTFSR
jgi:hypothetical protein